MYTDGPTAPYTVSPTNHLPGSESFTAGAIAGKIFVIIINAILLSLGTSIVVILFLLVPAALGAVIVIMRKRKSMSFKGV